MTSALALEEPALELAARQSMLFGNAPRGIGHGQLEYGFGQIGGHGGSSMYERPFPYRLIPVPMLTSPPTLAQKEVESISSIEPTCPSKPGPAAHAARLALVNASTQRRIHMSTNPTSQWRDHGVKVIPGSQLDLNTPQTPGMTRAAAITHARTGASKLWAGTVTIEPNAKTGAHHHGELESVIYVIGGLARMRWGEHLEFTAEAGPGDFIYVPPFVPHQEINANKDEVLSCVVMRSGQAPIVVNLDIEPAEPPEEVYWVDPVHPHP